MAGIGTILGNTGAKHSIDHNGKTYTFSYLDQKMRAEVEKSLFKKAREGLSMMKDSFSEENYEKKLYELNEEYIQGKFSFESDRGIEFLKSHAGAIKLMCLLLGADEMEVMLLMQHKQQEVAAMLTLVLRESLPNQESVCQTPAQ